MKYLALFALLCWVFGAAMAQAKNPICAEEFALVGPCRGLIPKWSYNPDKNECSKFSYSGCQGSNNNFETQEKCEESCKK
ncbi:male accessory gland serine protease inhibitor [Drosophila biarmipes]|uniref:male accessory gland serine protease inhibitor n=1 Tax=Drosophila biarmipes TaxID=125945 RepID=UPI0007E820DE|nr:male accessory gland serine protease inhibitor [Drosophila biarmipes]